MNLKELYTKADYKDKHGMVFNMGYIEDYDKKQWRLLTDSECTIRPIGKIEIEADGKNIDIKYFPKKMGNFFHEENCFKTEQEALEECDRRNGEYG